MIEHSVSHFIELKLVKFSGFTGFKAFQGEILLMIV